MTSCQDYIDLDTGERIMNVYCILNQGQEQELELSYIAPTGGTSSPVGESATITLFDDDSPVGQFTRVSETKWKLSFSPEGGHTYRLEVQVPGEETLSAETKYPAACTLRAAWSLMQAGFELESAEDLVIWCYYEKTENDPVTPGYIATDHPGVDGRGETIYPFDFDSPVFKEQFDNGITVHSTTGSVFPSELLGEPVFLHEKVLRIVHPTGFSRSFENLLVYHLEVINENLVPVAEESGKTGMFGIAGVDYSGPLVIRIVSAEYDAYLTDFYYGNPGGFIGLAYMQYYSNILNGTGIFGAYDELPLKGYPFSDKGSYMFR